MKSWTRPVTPSGQMARCLRRWYNRAAALLDRSALTQIVRVSAEGLMPGAPRTAGQVLPEVLPLVQRLDRCARLKLIAAANDLLPDGSCTAWTFSFHLSRRRATASCTWQLALDENGLPSGVPEISVEARPFPLPESPLRRLVSDGALLHQRLEGMWREERRRTPDLPLTFRDSDVALADMLVAGLKPADMEFSFGTGRAPDGRIAWVGLTRDRSYDAAFSDEKGSDADE